MIMMCCIHQAHETNTCSRSTIESLEQDAKYIQSRRQCADDMMRTTSSPTCLANSTEEKEPLPIFLTLILTYTSSTCQALVSLNKCNFECHS